MAISYVGAASAASNTVSLPTFQTGDFAVVVAINGSTTTDPTIPTGWSGYASSNGSDARGVSFGYRVLQAGDTTVGTWTNATHLGVVVYRGVMTMVVRQLNGYTPMPFVEGSAGAGGTAVVQSDAKGTQSASLAVGIVLDTNTGSTIGDASRSPWTARGAGRFAAYDVASESATFSISISSSGYYAKSAFWLVPSDATSWPIVADVDTTSGTQTSNSTSWTLTYPANIAAGDLLILALAQDGGSGFSSLSGWSMQTISNSSANMGYVLAKKASGTETGTFTVAIGASEQGAWVIYRIPSGTWYGGTLTNYTSSQTDSDSVSALSATGADANPNPPSLDPANWATENTLWLAFASADTSRTFSGYPSGMTNTGSLVSGGSTGASLGFARLESAVSSYDPGTFTISASDDWACATVAVRPAAAATPDAWPIRAFNMNAVHRASTI